MKRILIIVLAGLFCCTYNIVQAQNWTATVYYWAQHPNFTPSNGNLEVFVNYSGVYLYTQPQEIGYGYRSGNVTFTGSGTPSNDLLTIYLNGQAASDNSQPIVLWHTGNYNNVDCSQNYFTFEVEAGTATATGLFVIQPDVSLTTTPVSGGICSNTPGINLTAAQGPVGSSYVWQYSTLSNDGFTTLKSTSETSTTVSYNELASNGIVLGQPFYLRYTLGYCQSAPSGPYRFDPPAPLITSHSLPCAGSQINVDAFDRGKIVFADSTERFQVYFDNIGDAEVYVSNSTLISSTTPIVVPATAGQVYTLRAISTSLPGCGYGAASGNITVPGALTLGGPVVTPVSCYGASTGEITITASGGTGGYQYSLSGTVTRGNQGSGTFGSLPAGTYTVTVIDSRGVCSASATSITISQPSAPVSVGASVTSNYNGSQISCVGSSTGVITTTASGGTGAFQYSLSGTVSVGYQGSNVFSGLPAGNYVVTARDANSCTQSTSTINISPPAAINANVSISSAISCYGSSNGQVTASASGGTGAYQYSLSGPVSVGYQTNANFAALPTGTYFITAQDANGCTQPSSNITLLQPTQVTASATVTSNYNGSQVRCVGSADGQVTVTGSGGTGAFTYQRDGGAFQVSDVFNGLAAGGYNFVARDANGCTSNSTSATVINPTALSLSTSRVDVSCFGGSNGSITITPAGGSGTIMYSLNGGSYQTSATFSGLSTGTYSVAIRDGNSCPQSASGIFINQPSSPVSVSLVSKTDVTCFNASNGSITVLGSGGTGAFTYSKDGTNFQGSATFPGLAPGSFVITARDVNGCTQVTSSIPITQPATAVSISSINRTNPLCVGSTNGSLQVTGTGGTSPYAYSIDGTNYSTSNLISGLGSGNYVVTVRDANQCVVSSATQTLNNPPAINATATPTSQSCAAVQDGAITVTASGGTGTLAYSINGTVFQASNQFTGLASGAYTTTVRDGNSCTTTAPATVGMVAAIVGSISQTAFINCFSQSTAALNLSVSGGTPGYAYIWSNTATTQNISGLAAGSYSVGITDTKGCTGTANFSVSQPAQLTATAVRSDFNGFGVTCNGATNGFINLTVTGGTAPYGYSWSNSATTKDIASLAAGSYNVLVTDANSCTANRSTTLPPPSAVAVALGSKADATCFGVANGSATVVGSGGTGIFNYSINGGAWQTGNVFSGLSANTHSVQSRDQNNCISASALLVSIGQPTQITVTFSDYVDATCGQANGSVQANGAGGTGTLNYQWTDVSNAVVGTNAVLLNAPSGNYSVRITDVNSCIQTAVASVGSVDGAQFNVNSIVAVSCPASIDGGAQLTVTSGQGPFVITWGNGETGLQAIQLPGGSNSVSVQDGNNCTVASTFTVPTPTPISLSSVTSTSPDCVGSTNGSLQVTPTGGSGGYSFQWDGSAGTNTLSNIAAGSYSLVVTDSENCSATQLLTLNDVPPITINVINQVSPSCSSTADGSLQVVASGGNGSFIYDWDTGASSSTITQLVGGTYVVTARDAKNCPANKSIILSAPTAVGVQVVSNSSVLCFGGSDGTVTLSGSGGTGLIEYSINSGSSWQASTVFSNLSAGNLSILARDAQGCTANAGFTVVQPTLLQASITSSVNTTCNLPNGAATVLATGGTTPYNYEWTNVSNQVVGNNSSLQNTPAGSYNILILDGNGCSATSSVALASSTNSVFSVVNVTVTDCVDSNDGSASLNITSAATPYTILWSSGETTITATALPGGNGTVTITDNNGCQAQQIYTIPTPVPISVQSEVVTNPQCAGQTGSVQVTPTGGASPYTFAWNGVAGSNLNQTLVAGNHQLVVRDSKDCAFTKTYTLIDPPAFVIDLGPDRTVCSGTQVDVGVVVPLATYVWSGPGISQNNIAVIGVSQQGTYGVTVTDANGCIAQDNFILTLSENLLKADILAVSKAFVNDTIAVIDISWPVPTSLQWTFPQEATVVASTPDFALLKFLEPGVYPVSIDAALGNCFSSYQHLFTIEDRPPDGGRKPTQEEIRIVSMLAYPNPFERVIGIDVKLNNAARLNIEVYHLVSNKRIYTTTMSGEEEYRLELDFGSRESGIYVIVATAGDGARVLRVIKR